MSDTKEILPLSPLPPLFGHKSGKTMQTHWIAFLKPNMRLKFPVPVRRIAPRLPRPPHRRRRTMRIAR
jgi:hypothetical protein